MASSKFNLLKYQFIMRDSTDPYFFGKVDVYNIHNKHKIKILVKIL